MKYAIYLTVLILGLSQQAQALSNNSVGEELRELKGPSITSNSPSIHDKLSSIGPSSETPESLVAPSSYHDTYNHLANESVISKDQAWYGNFDTIKDYLLWKDVHDDYIKQKEIIDDLRHRLERHEIREVEDYKRKYCHGDRGCQLTPPDETWENEE